MRLPSCTECITALIYVAWPNVLRNLEPVVTSNRDARLKVERTKAINAHMRTQFRNLWDALPSDLDRFTFIPTLDFLRLPAVLEVMAENLDITHPALDIESLDACFALHLDDINQQITEFVASMREDLFQNWAGCNPTQRSLNETGESRHTAILNRLRLATTVFQTSGSHLPRSRCSCSGPIHYSTLFQHPFHDSDCQYARMIGLQPLPASNIPLDIQPNLRRTWGFYHEQLMSRVRYSFTMRKVISEAGLDPETATDADLEALGPYYPAHKDAKSGTTGPPAPEITTWSAEVCYDHDSVLITTLTGYIQYKRLNVPHTI